MNRPEAFAAAWRKERLRIEAHLRLLLRQERGTPRRLRSAMAHSLFGGGKRLRPTLLLWSFDAFGRQTAKRRAGRRTALSAACAFEMIHTYSLIHDDLPAMDDDVLRRGQPTCHVAFDEATAILAGDGLHALAFRILARNRATVGPVLEWLASAVGPAGMVGGQYEDLACEGRSVSAQRIRMIHQRKTAVLIAASLTAGAWLGGAGRKRMEQIRQAGLWLGLAFQGADDLLDILGSTAQIGKSVGKDAAVDKATWVRLEGLQAAQDRTARYGRKGCRLLQAAVPGNGRSRERLLSLASAMWNRTS